jgi:hypothetical protein
VSLETLDCVAYTFRLSETRMATLKGLGQPVEAVSVE